MGLMPRRASPATRPRCPSARVRSLSSRKDAVDVHTSSGADRLNQVTRHSELIQSQSLPCSRLRAGGWPNFWIVVSHAVSLRRLVREMALQAESARAPILPAHAHLQLSEMAT